MSNSIMWRVTVIVALVATTAFCVWAAAVSATPWRVNGMSAFAGLGTFALSIFCWIWFVVPRQERATER